MGLCFEKLSGIALAALNTLVSEVGCQTLKNDTNYNTGVAMGVASTCGAWYVLKSATTAIEMPCLTIKKT